YAGLTDTVQLEGLDQVGHLVAVQVGLGYGLAVRGRVFDYPRRAARRYGGHGSASCFHSRVRRSIPAPPARRNCNRNQTTNRGTSHTLAPRFHALTRLTSPAWK